ncbi:uncharacterized protein [Phyllobates terribilis]|uniref:uncharacterized protein isoform X1 n=1 Tax=Phyllobates terribilis TaxID=111132 RepID=UPI003CCADE43
MSVNMFKKMTYSLKYQKYMIPVSDEITNMVLSYVKRKTNGRPLDMAVDVGCGTGRYTLPLAAHFKKVLGLDISESQINVAKQMTLAKNVSYMVAPAEKLPLKDASVDLVQAGLAAHWFILDKFLDETVRVLKTRGCLAVHALVPSSELEYKNLSEDLNVVMSEIWDTLMQHGDKCEDEMLSQYQNIFETIPLKDKERSGGFFCDTISSLCWVRFRLKSASYKRSQYWTYKITDIPVKIQLSIPEIIGFIQSVVLFQKIKEKDEKRAEQFLTDTEKRFREVLGEEADSAQMSMNIKHYCVLACKQ